MVERTEQRTRRGDADERRADEDRRDDPVGPDVDTGPGTYTDAAGATLSDRVRARVASPFGGLFSLRAFLASLALAVVGMVLVGGALPLPGAGVAGIALAGFAVGLGHGHRRYLELLLAGAVTAGVGSLFQYLALTVVGVGAPLVALGTSAGALAAVAGHYFGRDLRDGLTKDL